MRLYLDLLHQSGYPFGWVRPGEYALRVAMASRTLLPLNANIDLAGWKPTIDWAPERVPFIQCSLEEDALWSALCGRDDRANSNAEHFVPRVTVTYGSNAGSGSHFVSLAHYVLQRVMSATAARERRLPKSKISGAVEQLAGGRFRLVAMCFVVDVPQRSVNWRSPQEFMETLRELVDSRRESLKRRAQSLVSLVRRLLDPALESGSAAAIAKRMNPLGAPPQFA
ncbi:hypothetical protein WJ32_18860 (plasmid) [Burkholderia ubonensis]|uniref:Uncharacterized protein n=2 Tax=Burkholderia ubonensis TaxID=101571 RepID=A0A103QP74_9BURK|nr:hypothetical protein WJ32_18860 [Burkholderia ubonensis]KVG53025.1 hypothetical protein WJ33_08515 [Burkholderia ubonensis]